MKAYIINIIICLFFSVVADASYKNKKNKIGMFFLILVALTMSVISGLRSETVGTDIHNYVISLFRDFSMYGNGIISNYTKFGVEIGFTSLVFLFSKFNNINFVLFGIQLAIVIPLLIYCYKVKDKTPISLNVFIFLMTMYCYSLSMMRQSISITIGLLATFFFQNNQEKKGFICIGIAYLFHRTSIVIFAIYILTKYIYKKSKDSYLYLFLMLFVTIVLAVLSPKIITLLPVKYSGYLGDKFTSSVNILSIMKKIVWYIPILICMNKIKDKDSKLYKDLLLTIFLISLDLIIYLIGMKIPTVSRLSLYFSNISCFIYFPYIIKMFRPKIFSQTIYFSIIIFMWWHMTVNDVSANIYPYKTDILPALNTKITD